MRQCTSRDAYNSLSTGSLDVGDISDVALTHKNVLQTGLSLSLLMAAHKLDTCQADTMLTPTPATTATALDGQQIFFDQDGHPKFAPDDPEDPQNYPFGKCYITAVAITLVMNATFSSSAPSGSLQDISSDLHVSHEEAGLITTLFPLGYCTGPLFGAPLSEFYGRRWIFFISDTGGSPRSSPRRCWS
ncbi:hypothetical protein BJY01DRAFT_217686 [Aspergillus pseudoustus]|uniref:Major facilitator superfamily (MFS) profile domain-containing protein n=1 Tax=Aspergillus pseudoustus TaxID=1810923 RepID=A0ABR4JMK5_9EURO